MNFIMILIWIILISAFSFFGSWYVKKYNKADALIGLYVGFVLISNVLAYKIAAFDLGIVTFFATSATLVFSVTFLLTDIINEKFGRQETQKAIFIAFLTQLATALFIWMSINLTPAPFWQDQEIFTKILSFAPRVMLASLIAFIISQSADAYIFSWFKKISRGKHLWMRNTFSSIPSMALDTILFVIIAFAGVQPLMPLMVGVIVLKWLVGIVNIPFMYMNRWIIYKK